MTTRRRRRSEPLQALLVPLLFLTAIGCLLAVGYVIARGPRQSNPPGPAAGRVAPLPAATGTAPRPSAAAPAVDARPRATPPPSPATVAGPVAATATATRRAQPEPERPPSPIEILAAHPYFASADDYTALRQALLQDDLLSARLALNELTLEDDAAKAVLERLFAIWPRRHALIADYCAATRVTLTLNDPLAGKPSRVVTAGKDGVTLEFGVSSHVLPWERVPPQDQLQLWRDMALNEQAGDELRLHACFAHLLAQDFVTGRLLLRRQRPTAADGAGLPQLVAAIEHWNILRLAIDAHLARQNGERTAEEACIARLTRLAGLAGNEWAGSVIAGLARPAAAAGAPAQEAAGTSASPIAIAGLDRPVTMIGNWSPDRLGARCVGGGDLRLGNLDGVTAIELSFTPVAFQGGLRLQLRGTSIAVDFARSVVEIRSGQGAPYTVPVAIFPRNRNSLALRFGDQRDPLRLRINHDHVHHTVAGTRSLSELTLSLSPGSDIRVHHFACE